MHVEAEQVVPGCRRHVSLPLMPERYSPRAFPLGRQDMHMNVSSDHDFAQPLVGEQDAKRPARHDCEDRSSMHSWDFRINVMLFSSLSNIPPYGQAQASMKGTRRGQSPTTPPSPSETCGTPWRCSCRPMSARRCQCSGKGRPWLSASCHLPEQEKKSPNVHEHAQPHLDSREWETEQVLFHDLEDL